MYRNLPGSPVFIILVFCFFSWNCTKIDTTTLGGDLIPAVDNVHTFEQIFNIDATQGLFNDSSRLRRTDLHVVGSITNDPVFGKTFADLYLQLKPGFYPYYFGSAKDTIDNNVVPGTGFDSVVLCLSSTSFYGDTNAPQTLSVYQISSNAGFVDSSYQLNFHADSLPTKIGEATVTPTSIKQYTYFHSGATVKDSVSNQIRIPLTDPAFLELLTSAANRDTTDVEAMYRSDSLFKDKLKGFVVVADRNQGSALFYVDLTNVATRLEFHYKRQNNRRDTSSAFFYFSSGTYTPASAHASHVTRDRSGAEYNPTVPSADALYLQTTPGTYANLSIPGLSGLQNSIIHRAEINVEQIPTGPSDDTYQPPLYLYLDLVDTAAGNPFKPIYFDLNPSTTYYPDNGSSSIFFPADGINYYYFGGPRKVKSDGAGGSRYYYRFNISRYVQHIVTNHLYNYTIRLYAPFDLHYYSYSLPFLNNVGYGRIKVGSGSNPNDAYRMKLRIIYSKI